MSTKEFPIPTTCGPIVPYLRTSPQRSGFLKPCPSSTMRKPLIPSCKPRIRRCSPVGPPNQPLSLLIKTGETRSRSYPYSSYSINVLRYPNRKFVRIFSICPPVSVNEGGSTFALLKGRRVYDAAKQILQCEFLYKWIDSCELAI